jgi:hypothetical protein
MIGYLIFGCMRNCVGIAILYSLVSSNMNLTLSLFLTTLVGFMMYVVQVKITIGPVDFLSVGRAFVFLFVMNRVLLWLLFEQSGIPLVISQFMSIILISGASYIFLKARVINTGQKNE